MSETELVLSEEEYRLILVMRSLESKKPKEADLSKLVDKKKEKEIVKGDVLIDTIEIVDSISGSKGSLLDDLMKDEFKMIPDKISNHIKRIEFGKRTIEQMMNFKIKLSGDSFNVVIFEFEKDSNIIKYKFNAKLMKAIKRFGLEKDYGLIESYVINEFNNKMYKWFVKNYKSIYEEIIHEPILYNCFKHNICKIPCLMKFKVEGIRFEII
jgi:hypothetical protein